MIICMSCSHAHATPASFCEQCGAALPTSDDGAGDDDVLSLMMGRVCPSCDSYNDPGTSTCAMCQTSLVDDAPLPLALDPPRGSFVPPPVTLPPTGIADVSPPAPSPSSTATVPAWMQAPEGKPLATAHAMPAVALGALKDQGRSLEAPSGSSPALPRIETATPAPSTIEDPTFATIPTKTTRPCPTCSTSVHIMDRFCASCGTRLDGTVPPAAAPTGPAGTVVMAALAAKPAPAPAIASATMVMPALHKPADASMHVDRGPAAPSATMFFGAATVERFARLILVKGHTQFGTQWRLQGGTTVVGRSEGMVLFPDDTYLAPRHCQLEFRGDALFVTPLPSTNGVFVRLTVKEEVQYGSELILGLERLRVLDPENAQRVTSSVNDGAGTSLQGSLVRAGDVLALERICQNGTREVYWRPQRVLSIGRSLCDVNFPDDGYLSTRHAQLTRTGHGAFVEDLGSRNGTFVRVHVPRQLHHGDIVLVGEQVLRVELSLTLPRPA